MHYIKVLATDSTNTELKTRFQQGRLKGNTCLSTKNQTKGRGQRGTAWRSEVDKNLTFSILLNDLKLPVALGFKLSALVSLALVKVIKQQAPKVMISVKWPNDILAGNLKIGGILIENILRKSMINHSLIGIGLNVNQTDFGDLRHAGSLKNLTGKTIDREKLLMKLGSTIEDQIYSNKNRPLAEVLSAYEAHLFKLDKPSWFEFPNGQRKEGIITGVNSEGHLMVKFAHNLQSFRLKEIKMIY